jgi:hypothetical protein
MSHAIGLLLGLLAFFIALSVMCVLEDRRSSPRPKRSQTEPRPASIPPPPSSAPAING